MERIRFFNIISYRVIISRSLETDRKFTKVCSTKGKVKIVRVSSAIEGHGILGQAQGEGQEISFPSLGRVTSFPTLNLKTL